MFLGFVNACKENQKEKTAGTQMVPTAIRMTTK
jgi:hypothetical protein